MLVSVPSGRMRGRQAQADKEIKERADSYKMVTTAWNSQVKNFAKSDEEKFVSIPIDDIRTLDDLKDKTVTYERNQLREASNNLPHKIKTPRTNETVSNYNYNYISITNNDGIFSANRY